MQDFINACHANRVRVRSRVVGQLMINVPNVSNPISLRQGEIRDLTKYGILNLKACGDLKRYIALGDIEVLPV